MRNAHTILIGKSDETIFEVHTSRGKDIIKTVIIEIVCDNVDVTEERKQ
jgi:hypothetical protein